MGGILDVEVIFLLRQATLLVLRGKVPTDA